MTPDELDLLVDTDPLALRDEAIRVARRLLDVEAERDRLQHQLGVMVAKWEELAPFEAENTRLRDALRSMVADCTPYPETGHMPLAPSEQSFLAARAALGGTDDA